MKPKSADRHSWKAFWMWQAFAIPAMGLFATLMIWRWPQGTQPPFDRALVVGLLAALGGFVIGLIHRAISGRNNSMGFLLLMTFNAIPRDLTEPLVSIVGRQCLMLFMLTFFFAVIDILHRERLTKTSKLQSSPMADAEIDARPMI